MGMYDTFYSNNKFNCSHCNKEYRYERGIQSKQFESCLEVFRTGDMPTEIEEDRKVVIDSEYCELCNGSVPIYFSFHRGIYVEAFDTYEEAELNSSQFDIIGAYRDMYKNKEAFKDNFNCMRNDLMSVHELHSKKPSKHKFTTFMVLMRDGDILDFNIVRTIKNIINKYKTF